MTEYCKQCGSVQMHWPDIAAAMADMIEAAPNGIKPMFRQAIDEIRELRHRVDYPPWHGPIVTTYRGIPLEELCRDAMRYRRIRENWITVKELNIDGRTVAIDSAVDYWLGQK